jgi:DNA-binding transcriptional ArsR family regulator
MKATAAAAVDREATHSAVAALAALAQSTRLSIFRLLLEHAPEGLTPGAIAARLELAPATLSFHLKELTNANLVDDRRESRFIWYRANVAQMRRLVDYLTENCCRATRGVPPACRSNPSRNRRCP